MPYVESSAIRRIAHDEASRELRVTFTSGKTYIYYGVPRATYEAFIDSPSKGQFFNEHIKDRYSFVQRR